MFGLWFSLKVHGLQIGAPRNVGIPKRVLIKKRMSAACDHVPHTTGQTTFYSTVHKIKNRSAEKKNVLHFTSSVSLKKKLNAASKPAEHPPDREKYVEMFS